MRRHEEAQGGVAAVEARQPELEHIPHESPAGRDRELMPVLEARERAVHEPFAEEARRIGLVPGLPLGALTWLAFGLVTVRE